ncbi:unnamed protein product, partial [Prorocentrum cordatum]
RSPEPPPWATGSRSWRSRTRCGVRRARGVRGPPEQAPRSLRRRPPGRGHSAGAAARARRDSPAWWPPGPLSSPQPGPWGSGPGAQRRAQGAGGGPGARRHPRGQRRSPPWTTRRCGPPHAQHASWAWLLAPSGDMVVEAPLVDVLDGCGSAKVVGQLHGGQELRAASLEGLGCL